MGICLQPAGELFARQIQRDVAGMAVRDAAIRRRFERWREEDYPGTRDEPPAEPLACPLCQREYTFGIDCPADEVRLVGTSAVVAAADGIDQRQADVPRRFAQSALVWCSAGLVALASCWFLAAVLLPWVTSNPHYRVLPWHEPERVATYKPRAAVHWHPELPPARGWGAGRLWVEARSEGGGRPGLIVSGPGMDQGRYQPAPSYSEGDAIADLLAGDGARVIAAMLDTGTEIVHVAFPRSGTFEVSVTGDETATEASPVVVLVHVDEELVVDTRIVLEPLAPPVHVCDVEFPSGMVTPSPASLSPP